MDNDKDEKSLSRFWMLSSDIDFPSDNSLGPYGEVPTRDVRGDLHDGDRMPLLCV